MDSYDPHQHCQDIYKGLLESTPELKLLCDEMEYLSFKSEIEDKYSRPLIFIVMYIVVASTVCFAGIIPDFGYAIRTRKIWFPCKKFSLNATFITLIAVAMKLPMDLSTPMPSGADQLSKFGGLAFMCTMMSNLMPSLASMDNMSLLANVTALSILVIMLIGDIFIQIWTQVIMPRDFYFVFRGVRFPKIEYTYIPSVMIILYTYIGMLIFLLLIIISYAIAVPTLKKTLENKYQAASTTLNDQHPRENLISLRLLVKRYWILAETGDPQFVMASSPLSIASGVICAISMLMHIYVTHQINRLSNPTEIFYSGTASNPDYSTTEPESEPKISSISAYGPLMSAINLTQFTGVVVGSLAPMFRCFTVLSFKPRANRMRNHLLVFKVDKYWTHKLCEWKEIRKSRILPGRVDDAWLHYLKTKTPFLSFCIAFQTVIVILCKLIGLIPIVVIIFFNYCTCCFEPLKTMLFTPYIAPSSDDTYEDLSNYVLLLEDNMQLTEKEMKRILGSMNVMIQFAEEFQHEKILKFLERSVAFEGVEMFDTDQVQSLLLVEPVNSWSLPIVSLTCIAIALPNIHEDTMDNLFESVGQGLLYTHIVEESLNKAPEYVNIRWATAKVWHEVENKCKWLENTLERSAYEGKTPTEIIKSFVHIAEKNVDEFNTNTHGDVIEKESLPSKVIAANSMYRIAKTIMHTYEINNLEITEDELFTRLSSMIADILVACLTNIPRVLIMKCRESAIEKREDSVAAAIDLLGRTSEIIKRVETRLPSIDQDKMAFIDEWRLHLRQP